MVTKGFRVTCPLCQEHGACITVLLADVNELHCNECDGDFTLEHVRAVLDTWKPIVAWLDTAPIAK